ncbi:hypothetical protein [Hydrogenimonas sp.]
MKNYAALARLRRQQFERAEQELAMANAHLETLRRRKEALRAQEREIEPPVSGRGAQLGALLSQKRALKRVLEALEYEIEAAERAKREKERLLKAAHIAWEQAKSIEAKFLREIAEKRKRETQSRLDEIASQRFWRERHGWKKEGEA